jgi:hypothetical protein
MGLMLKWNRERHLDLAALAMSMEALAAGFPNAKIETRDPLKCRTNRNLELLLKGII